MSTHTPYIFQRKNERNATFRWLAPNILKLNLKNKITSRDFDFGGHTWRFVIVRLGGAADACNLQNTGLGEDPLSIFVELSSDTGETWACCTAMVVDNHHTNDAKTVERWQRFTPADRTAGFRHLASWAYVTSPNALRAGEKSESVLFQIGIHVTGETAPDNSFIQLPEVKLPALIEEPVAALKTTLSWGASWGQSALSALVTKGREMVNATSGDSSRATVGDVPWESVPYAWRAERDAWSALVLTLAADANTYLWGPERTVSHEDVAKLESVGLPAGWLDLSTEGVVPASLPEGLLANAHVVKLRFELVPKRLSEDKFWRAFYWKVRELSRVPEGATQKEKARVVLSLLNRHAMREVRAQLESLIQQCVEAARLLTDVVTDDSIETEDIARSAKDSCTSMIRSLKAAKERNSLGAIDSDLQMKIDAAIQFAESALNAKPPNPVRAPASVPLKNPIPSPALPPTPSAGAEGFGPDSPSATPSSDLLPTNVLSPTASPPVTIFTSTTQGSNTAIMPWEED